MAAAGAGIAVPSREQVAAPAADLRFMPPDVRRRRFVAVERKEVAHVHVAQEETVVEDAEVPPDPMLRGVLDAAPPGCMALAALDEGKVNGVFVGLEVVGVADAVGRTARATLGPWSASRSRRLVRRGGRLLLHPCFRRCPRSSRCRRLRAPSPGRAGAGAGACAGARAGPVVRRPQVCDGRGRGALPFLVQAAHHAAQLPHPDVQLHVQERPHRRVRTRAFTLARDRDQRAEGAQAELRLL